MSIPPSVRWLTLAAGLLAGGCGEAGTSPLAPVRGKVFYKGQTLTTGTIVFAPDAVRGTQGALAQADIQTDGSYTMKSGNHPGAVVGWHRVTVLAIEMPASPPPGQSFSVPRSLLPEKYRDPELSGLTCEVKANKDNEINFHLQ
jgi:hypothetical protein